jgi:hypothetical protein
LPLTIVDLSGELHLGHGVTDVMVQKPALEPSPNGLSSALLQDGGHEQSNQNKLK